MILRMPTTSQQTRGIRAKATLAAVAVVASVAMTASPAAAVDNNREGAAEAVARGVAPLYKNRKVETSCDAGRSPFRCRWWVIRARSDRRAVTGLLPVMKRAGEGSLHKNPRNVFASGEAKATWTCFSTDRKGRCKQAGFQVRIS